MTVKEKYALKGEYTMAGKWTEYSDEQLLEMLKKTIEDMGMTKYPSRTELQKHIGDYDIPSPTSYLYRFDCSWQELMNNIGYEYDLEELYSEINKKNAEDRITDNTGRKKENVRWRDESRSEIVDAIVKNMREYDIFTFTEYKERRDRKSTPSAATLSRKNIKWSEIKNEYKARYG
jgi:hypothetical protein